MSREQYQLTDAKLVNNLFDLIADGQKLDGITVTQLCLKSGVARKTFYRHYSSTQKIIEGFLDNSANDFIGILKEAPVLCLNDFIDDFFKFWFDNKNRRQVLQNYELFSYTVHRLIALKLLDIINLTESSNWQDLNLNQQSISFEFCASGLWSALNTSMTITDLNLNADFVITSLFQSNDLSK